MVMKMVEEEYDGLSEEEKYRRAIGEYKVRDEDLQEAPDEFAGFYIPKEIPSCMAGGKYKKDPTIGIRKPSRYECFIINNGEIIAKRRGFVWEVPYKVVERAIQEIKEKGIENVSGRTKLLIDLAKEEQVVEKEERKGTEWFEAFDYNFRKEMYEKFWMVDSVRGEVTREGPLQLDFQYMMNKSFAMLS